VVQHARGHHVLARRHAGEGAGDLEGAADTGARAGLGREPEIVLPSSSMWPALGA
jgi:hypothetical protein